MKITKYFLSMAAAVGMITGCQKQEMAQISAPEDAVAPVLEAVKDVVFTAENIAKDSVVFNWSPLEYGVPVEIDYTLEAALPDGKPVELAKSIKKPYYVCSYEELNGVLNYAEGLGLEAGQAAEVKFRVRGKFNDYEPVYSEYVTAKFTVVDAVAPVMNAFEGDIDINPDNLATSKAAFSWQPAKYGKNTPIEYSVAVGLPGGEKKVVVAKGIKTPAPGSTDFAAEVKYSDINGAILYDLEVPADMMTEVVFYAAAKIGNYTTIYSEPISVNAKVTSAKKVYKMLYMPGSYQDWKPDQAAAKFQVLYEFAGDGVFEGIADFGKSNDADRAWKFTREPSWDFDWGIPEGATPAPEAAEVTLHNNDDGNRSDIKIYTAKRYYHFTMDTKSGLLKHNYSFDQVGVVGAFTGWADGKDKVMEYNAAERRFWVDIEGLEGQFKFRLDGAWAKSWGANELGATVSNSDGNLEAEAGNYRVYLYISESANQYFELNKAMYGQDEPTAGDSGSTEPDDPAGPVPPTMTGWGIVGEITNWGNLTADNTYLSDVMLASDGTYLVAKGVALEGQFKFRKDGDWGVNFGAPGETEPFELTPNAETELAAGGKNFTIAAGTYDVYLDEANAKAWFINDGSYPGGEVAPEASEWGVVGVVNGWNAPDVTMYKTATEGLFVAYNVAMPDGGFKIRANGEWNDAANYGFEAAGTAAVDHAYKLICSGGSKDITLVAGNYDIWFDLTNSMVYIMTPGKPISEAEGGIIEAPDPSAQNWYLVGNFNGWATGDANYQFTKEGDWYVFKGFTADGQGVKFNAGSWDENRGGTFVAANEAIAVAHNGADMLVAAGTYDVYMNAATDTAYFMEVGKTPAN